MNLKKKITITEIKKLHEIHELICQLKDFYRIKRKKILKQKNAPRIIGNFPFGIWFRGQGNIKWDLTPGVYREMNRKIYDECNMLIHFKLMNPKYDALHNNNFDWLTLMQHYSVPTRLLDWSESILTALYFVVSNINEDKNDGYLCVLDARGLNQEVSGNPFLKRNTSDDVLIRTWIAENREMDVTFRNINDDPQISKKLNPYCDFSEFTKPVAVFPRRLNNRLIAQSGVFTIHGGKKLSHPVKKGFPNPISLEQVNKNCQNKFLTKILIKSKNKEKIRESLFALGIHEATIFPELTNQSNYFRELFAVERTV